MGSESLRIRKKRNVNEKLLNFDDIVINTEVDWRKDRSNKKLFVELGTGKGDFISQLAECNQDTYFIGLEMEATVVYAAARKVRDKNLSNVRLMVFDINNIETLFDESEVDRLYINFCDPWPKKRHAKRRLTYIKFLDKYKRILKPDGEIQFKTDNRGLFDFSLEQFELANAKVSEVTFDLHADNPIDNIETEYERKFSSLGFSICRCVVRF
ncbi:MAG: tRNA (guanosine(46)-N7)-methyltransferase TrmB [Selenomonadaceae bacterium]|nr:tRNA (guanosine(46)-N7)-methyltransferase TrmB [Selenomonadaceae bacterium]